MSIYVFSLLVGYFPNGVDYAQGYRAGILRKLQRSVRYIFAELPGRKDIGFYKKLGIKEEEMLSIHHYFLDHPGLGLTVNIKDKCEELKQVLEVVDVDERDSEIRLIKDGMVVASLFSDPDDREHLSTVHYFQQCKLIRTEVYTDQVAYADYFATADSGHGLYAKRTRRVYYHMDGSVAYEQIYKGDRFWYLFPDGRIFTKSEFFGEFVKSLCLSQKDMILIDRFAQFDYVQPLFQWKRSANVMAVMHAGHYFAEGESAYTVNFNQDYNYLFKYSGLIHTIIVSTQQQKEELREKLLEYQCSIPDIAVIPAGGTDRLRYPNQSRIPCSLLSVSRIQAHKRIDWIIESVIRAHQINGSVSLDIYGSGGADYMKNLQNMVEEHHAQDYIRFMGHQDVSEVYKKYEVFITASTFETLGLSIIEAISSGNAVIGLDVKYGSRLLIHSGENGYLIDFDFGLSNEEKDELIDHMAERIIDIFKDQERLEEFHKHSYEIAETCSTHIVEKKWGELLGMFLAEEKKA